MFVEPFELVHSAPGGAAGAQALLDAVSSFQPDLVYLHKVEDASTLGLSALTVPVVRMVHDHDLYCLRRHRYLPFTLEICTRPADPLGCLRCGGFFERDRSGFLPVRWRPITARLRDLSATRQLRRVIVASQFMASELARNAVPESIVRVVPLGVDTVPVPRASTEPRRLVFAGQVLRTKGLDLLLRALARLAPDVTLDVAGDGPQHAEYEALATELGLGGRVHWHGFLDSEGVANVLSSAAVVVFPSRWPEPFGLVGLEAMRAGRPVVGFDVGGVREWLDPDKTGILVPAGSVPGLTAALGRLIAEPDLARQMGNAGRAAFERTFTLDAYLDRLERQLVQATFLEQP